MKRLLTPWWTAWIVPVTLLTATSIIWAADPAGLSTVSSVSETELITPVDAAVDDVASRLPEWGTTVSSGASCNSSRGACQWCRPQWYGQADFLIWWTQGNRVPPLVTTSPNGTPRPQAGVLGQPGTQILSGGNSIDGNYRPGARFTMGRWLNPCHSAGLEVTWFTLGDGSNSGNFFASSTGDPILARPFFNTQNAANDAQLVAFPNIIEGAVQVQTSSEMHSVSVDLRRNWRNTCRTRIDLLGGYRFVRFREGIAIREDLNSTDPGGVVPIGTTFDIVDAFNARNDFNGGEIGLSTLLKRGCWSLDMLTKLAFGNMHQRVAIDGSTVVAVPGNGATQSAGGLLALPTNIGVQSRDRFALIPELNLNCRYQYSEQLSLEAGYSLLWITDVARSGSQIDTNVNPTYLPGVGGTPTGPVVPSNPMNTTSMWAQGLNVGVAWEF